MTQERKQRIVAAIREMMDTQNLSQNRMAKVMGVSPAHASYILKEEMWDKVSDQMWQQLEGQFISREWAIYETQNFLAIQAMCKDSQQYSENICITAYTAAGKTTGLEAYARRNASAYYVLCDQMMTPKDLAREIQRTMGMTVEGTARVMMMAIVSYLMQQENPVLLIDEADKLSDRCLMMLKVVYDRLKNRCGFVTAGTEVLREKIEKYARKNKLGYRELRRRFANYKNPALIRY